MSDHGLSTQQLAVICALSTGATMTAAAEQAGVHRNTVTNWLRNLLPFQYALAGAQYDRALLFREKLEELVDLAATAIHDILADPKTPPSVRLKAALAVLQTASTPPDPKKQIPLDIEKIIIKPQPTIITEDQFAPAPPVHNGAQHTVGRTPSSAGDPQLTQPQSQPNNAQSGPTVINRTSAPAAHNPAQPLHRETPKIGRNEPCPCGSGKKHKRCCLAQPPAQVLQNAA